MFFRVQTPDAHVLIAPFAINSVDPYAFVTTPAFDFSHDLFVLMSYYFFMLLYVKIHRILFIINE